MIASEETESYPLQHSCMNCTNSFFLLSFGATSNMEPTCNDKGYIILEKRFHKGEGKFSEWQPVRVKDVDKSGNKHVIKLKLGGKVTFMPSYLCKRDCVEMKSYMENDVSLNLHDFNGQNGKGKEPRLHVLMSENANKKEGGKAGLGYKYHK